MTMNVSIPLWFDSNKNIVLTDDLVLDKVSIPLWFDSNHIKQADRSQADSVSIPLWFDSNYTDNSNNDFK